MNAEISMWQVKDRDWKIRATNRRTQREEWSTRGSVRECFLFAALRGIPRSLIRRSKGG